MRLTGLHSGYVEVGSVGAELFSLKFLSDEAPAFARVSRAHVRWVSTVPGGQTDHLAPRAVQAEVEERRSVAAGCSVIWPIHSLNPGPLKLAPAVQLFLPGSLGLRKLMPGTGSGQGSSHRHL